ncbi:superoxide dismutase [Cu-Zn], chloroplastic-like [Cornus florida]|uniref:superoxide dismutase [Cu-Zn], chloroplastic-like n=1 Tax=Cornus florida TaxID=4283 RepID=UPI0028970442|nr:superoxide dismutase [Cu-Zn], chloroplastic-like [Cornus florida]
MAAHTVLSSDPSHSLLQFPLSNPNHNNPRLLRSSFHSLSLKPTTKTLALVAGASAAPPVLVARRNGNSNTEFVITLIEEDNGSSSSTLPST